MSIIHSFSTYVFLVIFFFRRHLLDGHQNEIQEWQETEHHDRHEDLRVSLSHTDGREQGRAGGLITLVVDLVELHRRSFDQSLPKLS
jgi:hypothetical protein